MQSVHNFYMPHPLFTSDNVDLGRETTPKDHISNQYKYYYTALEEPENESHAHQGFQVGWMSQHVMNMKTICLHLYLICNVSRWFSFLNEVFKKRKPSRNLSSA